MIAAPDKFWIIAIQNDIKEANLKDFIYNE